MQFSRFFATLNEIDEHFFFFASVAPQTKALL